MVFVDDHPVVLEGLTSFFSSDNSFEVVAKGQTASEAIELCSKYLPDILVIELGTAGNALGAIVHILQSMPSTKVVVFTATADIDSAVKALGAGASGYVLKSSTVEELRTAVIAVMEGEAFITSSLANKVVAALRSVRDDQNTIRLSFREQQITTLLLQGQTNKEIGASLNITEQTVKHYMTVLIQKFQVRNRLEVAIAAQKLNAATRQREPSARPLLN